MSRAERRAYKRMTKNQDPYALPAAAQRSRAARGRSRRPARPSDGGFQFVTGRFLAWTLGGAAATALIGFSVAWPQMPLALYVGLAIAAVWVALAVLVRAAQRRVATPR